MTDAPESEMREPMETTSTAPDVEPVYAAPAPTDAAVDEWFVRRFYNRGYTAELLNYLRESADELKARLRAKETP